MITTSNACPLEIPRRTNGQPHRQSHGTSFRQSNTALGMQQRVQVCGHRVDCEVGDLPDQDNHLSSKGWTKAWKVRSQDARGRPDDSRSLSLDASGPRAVRCESHWELDIHSRDGCHAQMYASTSTWNWPSCLSSKFLAFMSFNFSPWKKERHLMASLCSCGSSKFL